MPCAKFVHLRARSSYSIAEGAIKLDRLITMAETNDMPAIALTDKDNLFGSLEFSLKAVEKGVQPIIGCIVDLNLPMPSRVEENIGIKNKNNLAQILLLVKDSQGWKNLSNLVTNTFINKSNDQSYILNHYDLSNYSDGLIALSGGKDGPIGKLLLQGKTEEAKIFTKGLSEIFPERFYIELLRHGLEEERNIEPLLLEIANNSNLPLVATNDIYFETPDFYEAHDCLLCISEGSTVGVAKRKQVTPEHYFKTSIDMEKLFVDLPEAIENTKIIAQRCSFLLEVKEPKLPKLPTLKKDEKEEELLAENSRKGLLIRLKDLNINNANESNNFETIKDLYLKRLEYEISVINKMGFGGYFLIVGEFIKWAKKQGIAVGPGRGSGAGSLVAWSMNITDIDPIRFGLIFERFLNPERVSMPDFDIDFCQLRRDEVIKHVSKVYGKDHVAQIITFGSLQARAVVRDVGRVLEIPYNKVDSLAKLIPQNPSNPTNLEEAINTEPRLKESISADEDVSNLMNICLKLEGLLRNASTHAAGIVISDQPLTNSVPLYKDSRSYLPATQFSMKYIEKAGLVKFDFLGLKTLSVIEEAINLIKNKISNFSVSDILLDNQNTFKLLEQGNTVGVFQLESDGMKDVLRKLKADKFEEIIAVVALFRPGPMENIDTFINRKHNNKLIKYIHPKLELILKETYGVMIYQEQVMQTAQELAGYTLGNADILRRAMGKKDQKEMASMRATFIEGAIKNGIKDKLANEIFDLIDKFAGYGFNKSHAACYALLAYQTAWIKSNYTEEFFVASMNGEVNNHVKLGQFKMELNKYGIPFLGPDVNHSKVSFSLESFNKKTAVRCGLGAVKNVGVTAMAGIIKEREIKGKFINLEDFSRRIDPQFINKRQLESLAEAGAFDSLHKNRNEVFNYSNLILKHAFVFNNDKKNKQESLLNENDKNQNPFKTNYEAWNTQDLLSREYNVLGYFVTGHPLDGYNLDLERLGVSKIQDIYNTIESKQNILMAGVLLKIIEKKSHYGRYANIQIADDTGTIDLIVFSSIYESLDINLKMGENLLITSSCQVDETKKLKINAKKIELLSKIIKNKKSKYNLYVNHNLKTNELLDILNSSDHGFSRISIILPIESNKEVEVSLRENINLTPNLKLSIEQLEGVVSIKEIEYSYVK